MSETTKRSLIIDPKYKRGFGIRGLGVDPGDIGVNLEEKFGQDEKPLWTIAQWAARYSLADPEVSTIKELSKGVYEFKCPTNTLTVDTNEPYLIFDSVTSKCYDSPRKDGGGWLHLLVETSFTDVYNPDEFTRVKDLASVKVSGDVQLLKFKDNMGADFDPNLHAAQFLFYLTIHNANQNSPGFGEMIWFGINFFDNRYEWSEYSAMFDKGTSCLMVGLGNRPVYTGGKSFFENGDIVSGENSPSYKFDIEVLSEIKRAHETAQKEGYFTRTNLEDLCISGMNLGWEIPGSYDAAIKLKNFNIIAEY